MGKWYFVRATKYIKKGKDMAKSKKSRKKRNATKQRQMQQRQRQHQQHQQLAQRPTPRQEKTANGADKNKQMQELRAKYQQVIDQNKESESEPKSEAKGSQVKVAEALAAAATSKKPEKVEKIEKVEKAEEVEKTSESANSQKVAEKPTFEGWQAKQKRLVEEAYEKKQEELKLQEVALELQTQPKKHILTWILASLVAILVVLNAGIGVWTVWGWEFFHQGVQTTVADEADFAPEDVEEEDIAEEKPEVAEVVCAENQELKDGSCVERETAEDNQEQAEELQKTKTQRKTNSINIAQAIKNQAAASTQSPAAKPSQPSQPSQTAPTIPAEQLACERQIGPHEVWIVHWEADGRVNVTHGKFTTATGAAKMAWVDGTCRPALKASGFYRTGMNTEEGHPISFDRAQMIFGKTLPSIIENRGQDTVTWRQKNGSLSTDFMTDARVVLNY